MELENYVLQELLKDHIKTDENGNRYIIEEELNKIKLTHQERIFVEVILKNNNIDVDKGISLLGDIDMYNETIKDFYTGLDERVNKLNNLKNDMPNYAIEAHALKSDSKYLGLNTLSSIALEHELKSKENDINFVNDNYSKLLEEIEKVRNIIKEYIDKYNI